jgi:hypothetical protein
MACGCTQPKRDPVAQQRAAEDRRTAIARANEALRAQRARESALKQARLTAKR